MKDAATAFRVPDSGIGALFSQDSRWQAWLDVEVALARAEAELGMIPQEAAESIAGVARLELLDRARIDEGLARTGHPLVPVIWELSRICAGDSGRYVHWGATTQNILDTAEMLLMRRANRIYLGLLADALEALATLAERTAAMPQKRNPILAQDLLAGAAEVRATLPLALEATQVEHEANRANTQMMRRAVHGICEAVGGMLTRLVLIADGISVDAKRMRENLDLTGGLILAENLMLKLGQRIGRQQAHDVVYDVTEAAMAQGKDQGKDFAVLLVEDPVVRKHLDAAEIRRLLDPAAYTGFCEEMARQQAEHARKTAAAIRLGENS